MGPRAGVDGCEKSRPHRYSIPGPSSPQRVAIAAHTSVDWEATGKLMTVRSLCWAKVIKESCVQYMQHLSEISV